MTTDIENTPLEPAGAYSIAQIIRMANVSRPTVERWIASGALQVQYYPGTGTRPIRRVKHAVWQAFEARANQQHGATPHEGDTGIHYKGITIHE